MSLKIALKVILLKQFPKKVVLNHNKLISKL